MYASIHIYKFASTNVYNYTIGQVCMFARMQEYIYRIILFKFASMEVCKYVSVQLFNYPSMYASV